MNRTNIYDINGNIIPNPDRLYLVEFIDELELDYDNHLHHTYQLASGKEYQAYMQYWENAESVFYLFNNVNPRINFYINLEYFGECFITVHSFNNEEDTYRNRAPISTITNDEIINLMKIKDMSPNKISDNMKKLTDYLKDYIKVISDI